jgi:hypothetical protein
MKLSARAVMFLTCTSVWPAAAPALAQEDDGDPALDDLRIEEPRPFEQGDIELALVLGLGTGGGETSYALGGAFAYYVLPGVAPGIDVTVRGGSDTTTQTWALLPVKWVLYRSYKFAPYLVAAGGRIFLADDFPDLWIAGAGPGFHVFWSGKVGLKAELLFYRLFPKDQCDAFAEGCVDYRLGIGIGIVL